MEQSPTSGNMHSETKYSEAFYRRHRAGSLSSARAIVPILLELLGPASVVDVGCGLGTWLSAFREFGVQDVFGIDGAHVSRTLLEIPEERFAAVDLTARFAAERRFDLALSLEVAEHLPATASDAFVDSLVRLSDFVAFSAAIPKQGGEGHVNEQWPDYWIGRFASRGYEVVDCLRRRTWTDDRVEWWYAQNLFLFVERRRLASSERLLAEANRSEAAPVSLVHPRNYLHAAWVQDVLRAALEIAEAVPSGETFILLDDNRFGYEFSPRRRVVRFAEGEDWYWRSPPDEEAAVRELDRLRTEGASFLVVGWPAYAWLGERPRLKAHLDTISRRRSHTELVSIFELRSDSVERTVSTRR
jgi:SAM-dependent methyltransferase